MLTRAWRHLLGTAVSCLTFQPLLWHFAWRYNPLWLFLWIGAPVEIRGSDMAMPTPKTSELSLSDLVAAINWLAVQITALQVNDANVKTALAQLAADNSVSTYVAPTISATAVGSLPSPSAS